MENRKIHANSPVCMRVCTHGSLADRELHLNLQCISMDLRPLSDKHASGMFPPFHPHMFTVVIYFAANDAGDNSCMRGLLEDMVLGFHHSVPGNQDHYCHSLPELGDTGDNTVIPGQ